MELAANTRRLGRAAGVLVVLAASLLLSIGAVELLLRSSIIPNEYYLRNQVLGDAKQKGLFLMILGDSFMAPAQGGDIVDYLYAILAPHGVRIRNTAIQGNGPVQYLENLRREGSRYRPDVLLLSYYVGNDLLDVGCGGNLEERVQPPASTPAWKRSYAVQYVRERLRTAFPGRVTFQSIMPGPEYWLSTARAFWRLLDAASLSQVDYAKMREAGIPEEYIESAKAGRINPWIVSLGARRPDYYRDELMMRSECAQQAWLDTRRVLDLILDEAGRLGAPVLPVIHPHTFQVSRAHYDLYRAWKIEVDDEMLQTNRPQQLLREYFRSRGLEPLDLLDAFRAQAHLLYWDFDEHLNLEGQQLAATLMAEAVLRTHRATGRK